MRVLDHPLIAERYFFPRPDRLTAPTPVTCRDGAVLHCYHHQTADSARTLVHFHGNGEVVADYVPDYVEAIANLGLNLFMVEYRAYGGSDGRPFLGQLLDDVADVRAHLGLPGTRTLVYGRSVGSMMAIEWAATDPTLAGLVLESGIADPLERIRLRVHPSELGPELEAAVAERLDHQQKLGSYPGRLLVLHAAGDDLVEPSHARRNHAWAAGPKRLVIFERGNHNTIMGANWKAYLETLAEFVSAFQAGQAL